MSDTNGNADPAATAGADEAMPIVLVVEEGDRDLEPAAEATRWVSICSQNVTDD